MKGKGKEERTKWVSLLDPRLRGNSPTATEQVARFSVAPSCPREKAREVLLAMFKESSSINCVERVGEISFQKHSGGVVGVSFTPLSCCLETHLSAEGLRDANLERKQHVLSLVLVFFAQAFAGEASERFTHGDGADRPVFLW